MFHKINQPTFTLVVRSLNQCFQMLPKWPVKSLIPTSSPFKLQMALLPTANMFDRHFPAKRTTQ